MSNYKTESSYFDLHTVGIGYANRLREVKARNASFWAVDIAALHGSSDNVQYTRFDCRISGKDAQAALKLVKPQIDAKQKVLVGFKISDIYPETFVYEKGDKAGQTGVVLKGRLLSVAWIKVDGSTVYTAPKDKQADSEAEALRQAA
ncbi:MAG: hypothetical protein DM484_05285 [Candidatus Methylumidiphilus alinenensis]|uniref:DUF3577 domain-containing protein n=1 Tax=Candidatus Methylumidiphilus alinenensis TaxID=2202197 RepID=A0A2W4RTY8_9GAMM|nr:MAG: hypothetical protein DM484_05285 [Candidatus Methylumidiphilus alinenensis]